MTVVLWTEILLNIHYQSAFWDFYRRGPSKNYITAKEVEGVDDFVIYSVAFAQVYTVYRGTRMICREKWVVDREVRIA